MHLNSKAKNAEKRTNVSLVRARLAETAELLGDF